MVRTVPYNTPPTRVRSSRRGITDGGHPPSLDRSLLQGNVGTVCLVGSKG